MAQPPRDPPILRLLSIGFGLLGLALVVLAGVLGYGKYQLVSDGIHVPGQVVAYYDSYSGTIETNPQPRHGHLFSPVIEFRAAGDVPTRFTASIGGASPEPKLGTPVGVVYPRGKADAAVLDDPQAIWGLTAAAAAFGIPFLLLGLFGYRQFKQ